MFTRNDIKTNRQFIHDLHFNDMIPVGKIKIMFTGSCYDDIKNVILSFGKFPITEAEIKYQNFKKRLPIDKLKKIHYEELISFSRISRNYKVQEKYLHRLFNEYALTPIRDLSLNAAIGVRQTSKLSVDRIKKANKTIINHAELSQHLGVSETILRQYCKDHNIVLALSSNISNNALSAAGLVNIQEILSQMSVHSAAKELICSEVALRKYMKKHCIKCTYRPPTIINKLHYNDIYDMYYNKGMHMYEIAEHYNVSQYTIQEFMRNNNMPALIRRLKPTYDFTGLEDLFYKEFYTIPDLATHFNAPHGAVLRYMKSIGIRPMMSNTERRYSINKKDIVHDYTVEKLSLVALHQRHGIHADLLSKYLKKDGIKIEHRAMISAHHIEIMEYLKTLGIEFEINDRTVIAPYEIDILISSLKIGIEYHGLYYHSTARTTDYAYHNRKSKLAAAAGYQLVQIFADDWYNRQEIVKIKLKSLLLPTPVIITSQCVVKEISDVIALDFYKTYSFELNTGTLNYGAYDNNTLIAAMSVNLKRGIAEIVNYATMYNSTVLFSSLIDEIMKMHLLCKVIGYVDLSWESESNNLYTRCGFYATGEFIDYVYTHDYISIVDKATAIGQFESQFDTTLDEVENMKRHKHHRVYDAGHIVFCLDI